MKIAFIVHDYHRHGGHARYVAELAQRYKAEHEVHVYSNTFEEPEPEGIHHHHVPAWRANAVTTIVSFALPVTWQLARGFDIVHSQGFCGFRQNVVTAHMVQKRWFQSVDRYDSRQSIRKRVFRSIAVTADAWVYRYASAKSFIGVSKLVKENLREFHGLDDHVYAIPHAVDFDKFHPSLRDIHRSAKRDEQGCSSGDFVGLYVGHWEKASRPLLEMLPKVPNMKLWIVTKSNRTEIEQQATELGILDRITFVAPTKTIEQVYVAADVFLFPSFYDPFGMVVTEAMASGTPVIVSKAAGASEFIEHGKNGLLLDDAWDADELARNVRRLIDDPDLRREFSEAGRRTVEGYTWDDVAEITMQVFREVVSRKSK